MYCSFLFINDRVCHDLCMYTLYELIMSVYGYVLYESVSCVCLFLVDEPMLFCIYVWIICLHVWMAPRKISCKLTGSQSLNKVFELNWIELNWIFPLTRYIRMYVFICGTNLLFNVYCQYFGIRKSTIYIININVLI